MRLSQFLRGYHNIEMRCDPPSKPDEDGFYHHSCKFRFTSPHSYIIAPTTSIEIWGHTVQRPGKVRERAGRDEILLGSELRTMRVTYVTDDPNSVKIVTDGLGKTTRRSALTARIVLGKIALESALFDVVKGDMAQWAHLVDLDEDVPEEQVVQMWRDTERQAWRLRVFLEGREAAETRTPTVYHGLLYYIEEVATVLYAILHEAGMA